MRSLFSLGLLFVVACSSSAGTADGTKAPVEDPKTPGVDTPADTTHGAVSTMYPAFTPTMPLLQNKGGKVLTKPVSITVTFDDDANRPTWEQLGDGIGATPYWSAIVGEYGVGALTSGADNHVHTNRKITLPTDPNTDPIDTIFDWVQQQIEDPSASWPAPTDQSIYTVYFSGKTAQTLCDEGAGGLHDSIKLNSGKEVAVALVFACDGDPSLDAVQSGTVSASHELAEAAVDPYPETGAAWQGLRKRDLDWELMQMVQDENADMCEFYDDVYGAIAAPLTFTMQRQWSNASAAAGHAPCVPALADPYFNVALLDARESIVADFESLDGIPLSPNGLGYVVENGKPKTITLGFVSDGPTEAISVTAFESDAFDPNGFTLIPADKKVLDLKIDRDAGKNGEKVILTVTPSAALEHDVRLVVIKTKIGNTAHFMPLIVGTKVDTSAAKAQAFTGGESSTSSRRTHLRGGRAPADRSRLASRIGKPAIGARRLPSLRAP